MHEVTYYAAPGAAWKIECSFGFGKNVHILLYMVSLIYFINFNSPAHIVHVRHSLQLMGFGH